MLSAGCVLSFPKEIMQYLGIWLTKKNTCNLFSWCPQWIDYQKMITEWQDYTQTNANIVTESILSAGISTDEGLFGMAKDGLYLYDVLEQSATDIQEKITTLMLARLINQFFQMQVCHHANCLLCLLEASKHCH